MNTDQIINVAKEFVAEGKRDIAIVYLRDKMSECDAIKDALLTACKQIKKNKPVFNIAKDINKPKRTVTVKRFTINNIPNSLKRERDAEIDIFAYMDEVKQSRNLLFEKDHRNCRCTFWEYDADCPLRTCECHSCRRAGGPGQCEEYEAYF